MPEMAGVLRTRAAEETSALAPAAGASFSSRPASQRLDCGRGRTRIQNLISVSVETRSVHADSPLEHNAFSSNQGRHCEQGSGEANQGSERRRSFRTGYVKARQGSEGRPSRLDLALARRKTGVFRRICLSPRRLQYCKSAVQCIDIQNNRLYFVHKKITIFR
jgi:hypothetical protein